MKDLLNMNIQIADSNNNVLFDCQVWQKEVIVNDNLQIVKFEADLLQLKVKNYHIQSDVLFKGFPIWEPTENKYKVNKAMWNKLVKSGTAAIYNDFMDSMHTEDGQFIKEWATAENNGKITWTPEVLAHNAILMYLFTKFQSNAKKK